ncbi:hypothetical protein [Pedobacter sp. Leaf250]|uniref:hypothetical protein n=1 Tax=Pedobacter sp. Leaf250 TaxID=2876559 RepID=UPI001217DEFE|nr:hypothetical protein [Pedobacter sp. Leaf250]RZK64706.1 MAG: hypothetical protein EOO85_29345 [Pedobacter sp.]
MQHETNLLSVTEIEMILKESVSADYSTMLCLSRSKCTICHVYGGLILIAGNNDTGYNHIFDRHSPTSRIPYWTMSGKLGNPTKFTLGIAPKDYLIIAADIFSASNHVLNESSGDLFDLYVGTSSKCQEHPVEYRLLTYKGTGIVHTFYISDRRKQFKKNPILKLRRGWCGLSSNMLTLVHDYRIAYFTQSNTKAYELRVVVYEVERIIRWFLQINTKDGQPLLTCPISKVKVKNVPTGPLFMGYLDHHEDLTEIEKKINSIETGNLRIDVSTIV